MNENIKFTQDSPVGTYSKDDTGVMVAVCRDYTDQIVAVVRTEENAYITAPLGHVEYVAAEQGEE